MTDPKRENVPILVSVALGGGGQVLALDSEGKLWEGRLGVSVIEFTEVTVTFKTSP